MYIPHKKVTTQILVFEDIEKFKGIPSPFEADVSLHYNGR